MGSGHQRYKDFIGLDIEGYAMDICLDLSKPLPFRDNSVDEIFASHIIEHFPYWQIEDILAEWCRVLRVGGLFWGIVPDGERYAERYLECAPGAPDRLNAVRAFNGGYSQSKRDGLGNIHYCTYDSVLLQNVLSRAGFHPVMVEKQEAAPWDYRLVFVCGKGVYPEANIKDIGIYPKVWWRNDE